MIIAKGIIMMKINNILLGIFIALLSLSCNGENNEKSTHTEVNSSKETKKETKKGKVVHLDANTFKEKIMDYSAQNKTWKYKGERPAIIDFYADWCMPCRKIAPYMEEFAKKYEGKIDVYKVDTQKQRELAAVFNIRSIPAVLFIPMDGEPQMTKGALPKSAFEKKINEFLLHQK